MIDETRQWSGMLAVECLSAFSESQRNERFGLIESSEDWSNIWSVWRPGEPIPQVDFRIEVIVFLKNVRYLNHIHLRSVHKNGHDAIIEAEETRSARPIRDQLSCVMFVLAREDLETVSDGDKSLDVSHSTPTD